MQWHYSIYYENEAYRPENGMQFRYDHVSAANDDHCLIFDGNGGTLMIYGKAWKSVDWTKVQTLKVFSLDANGTPIGAAAERLIKGRTE